MCQEPFYLKPHYHRCCILSFVLIKLFTVRNGFYLNDFICSSLPSSTICRMDSMISSYRERAWGLESWDNLPLLFCWKLSLRNRVATELIFSRPWFPWDQASHLLNIVTLPVPYIAPTSLSLFTFTHWRRKWQLTPVFLPGESEGRGSLVGCRLWGRTESDPTEAT